jgi:hypothetical protein
MAFFRIISIILLCIYTLAPVVAVALFTYSTPVRLDDTAFHVAHISFSETANFPFYAVMLYAWFCLLFPKKWFPAFLIPFIPLLCLFSIFTDLIPPVIELMSLIAQKDEVTNPKEIATIIMNTFVTSAIGLIATAPVFIGSLLFWKRNRHHKRL